MFDIIKCKNITWFSVNFINIYTIISALLINIYRLYINNYKGFVIRGNRGDPQRAAREAALLIARGRHQGEDSGTARLLYSMPPLHLS